MSSTLRIAARVRIPINAYCQTPVEAQPESARGRVVHNLRCGGQYSEDPKERQSRLGRAAFELSASAASHESPCYQREAGNDNQKRGCRRDLLLVIEVGELDHSEQLRRPRRHVEEENLQSENMEPLAPDYEPHPQAHDSQRRQNDQDVDFAAWARDYVVEHRYQHRSAGECHDREGAQVGDCPFGRLDPLGPVCGMHCAF